MKGGEQSKAMWATVNKSPGTFVKRHNMACITIEERVIQSTKRKIYLALELNMEISKREATITLKIKIKNIPNSKVLGKLRILLLKEATMANVVMVRRTTTSFSPPVISIDNPAPIARKQRESINPSKVFGNIFFEKNPS